jgi:hypothetical protein
MHSWTRGHRPAERLLHKLACMQRKRPPFRASRTCCIEGSSWSRRSRSHRHPRGLAGNALATMTVYRRRSPVIWHPMSGYGLSTSLSDVPHPTADIGMPSSDSRHLSPVRGHRMSAFGCRLSVSVVRHRRPSPSAAAGQRLPAVGARLWVPEDGQQTSDAEHRVSGRGCPAPDIRRRASGFRCRLSIPVAPHRPADTGQRQPAVGPRHR